MTKKKLILPTLIVVLCAGLFFQSINLRVSAGTASSEYTIYMNTESFDSFQEYSSHENRFKIRCAHLDYFPILLHGSRNKTEEIFILKSLFRENTDKLRLRTFLTNLYTSQA